MNPYKQDILIPSSEANILNPESDKTVLRVNFLSF